MQVDRIENPPGRWRYFVPGGKLGWGAVVYIESSGLFICFSDWGTYGHRWTAPGGTDVREFFLAPEGRLDYFVSKFAPGQRVLDCDATEKAIKKRIRELRKARKLTDDEVRRELDLATCFTNEVEMAMHWYPRTLLSADDSHDLPVFEPDPQTVSFCKIILPALAKMIEAELAQERAGPTVGAASC
jgi:hypothetical protein